MFIKIKIAVTETETETETVIITLIFIALNVLLRVSVIYIDTQLRKKLFIHFKIIFKLCYIAVICKIILF